MNKTDNHNQPLDFERITLFSLFLISAFFWLSTNQDDPIIIKIAWSLILLFFILFWSFHRSIEWYFSIILTGLCLRFWIISFEGFEQLPTQDSIQDFQVFLVFLESDSLFVLPTQLVDGLSKYSAFPVLHSLAISASVLTGTDSFFLAYSITTWLFASFICSVTSLIIILSSKASLNLRIVPLGLIVVCFEPISVYWTGQMARQLIGLVLVITFYSLLLLFTETKYRIRLAIITSLVCILQPASHHLSSANAIFLISGVTIVLLTLSLFSPRFKQELPNLSINSMVNMVVILSVTTILWWELVGTYVAPFANGIIDRIWQIFSNVQAEEIETVLNARPESLMPPHIVPLIWLKVAALFGSTALGFIFMNWKQYKSGDFFKLNVINSYVLVSFSWFVILLLWAESTRVILFAIPVMAISSGYILDSFWKHRYFRFSFIVAVFTGAMLAPYSFGYTPEFYFHDDTEGPEMHLGQFSNSNSDIAIKIGTDSSYSSVFVDTPWAFLSDDVSFEQAADFHTIPVAWRSDPQNLFCEDCTLVLFQGGYRYYHLQGGGGYADLTYNFSLEERGTLLQFLEEQSSSKVFDQGQGLAVFKN